MSEHTKEPWGINKTLEMVCDAAGENIKSTPENLRRIVACVNACGSIETEALESFTGRMILHSGVELWMGYCDKKEEVAELNQQRVELLALVKGFHRKLETYRNVYSGDKELRRLLDECEAAIAKENP